MQTLLGLLLTAVNSALFALVWFMCWPNPPKLFRSCLICDAVTFILALSSFDEIL